MKLLYSKPKALFFLAIFVGFIFMVGCGATRQFNLGIPASKSESFFFHMKKAAMDFGHSTSLNSEGRSLTIRTKSGTLVYQTNDEGDGLEVVLSSKVHQSNKEIEQRWLRSLEKTHEKVLARARILSKSNQDWN